MFCSKCGREVPDNALFCAFCGEKAEDGIKTENSRSDEDTVGKYLMGMSGMVPIMTAIGYIYIAGKWFESNSNAFEWLDLFSQWLGVCLHWGICLMFCIQCIAFIRSLSKEASAFLSIKFGGKLIMEGFVLKVLAIIYDDWSNSDMSIVLFRIFGRTYSEAVVFTIFMGVLLLISGFVMHAKENG